MSEDRSALLSTRLIHDGRIVRLSLDTVRYPDGSVGELEMIRPPWRRRGAPRGRKRGRTGSRGDPAPPVQVRRRRRDLRSPGRDHRAGESWEECARRELEEEAGVRAGRLVELTTIHTTPGFTNEQIHLFAAFDLKPGTVSTDSDEFLEAGRMPLSRAVELVRRGEVSDGKSVVTILYAAHFLARG